MDRLIASYSVPLAQADTAPTTGTPQYATDGNPATNTPATLWPAYAWNAMQDEIYNVIVGGGLTPDRNAWNQLLLAIKRLIQAQVELTDTGIVNAYAATNSPALVAGTWVNGVVQQIIVAHTNTGPSTYAPDGLTPIPIYGLGLSPLQQGEMFAGGAAKLMKQTIAGVNGGNPICVLLECSGGAQQVPAATATGHAVQFGQVAGIVGSVRNLKCNNAAASTSLTFTAEEIVAESALGGLRYCLANFNATVASGTTGLGGLDVGTTLAANSAYLVYAAIKNDGTKGAFLQLEPAGGVAPSVYGGANLPANVVATALIGVWTTNGSAQFVSGYQADRKILMPSVTALTTSTQQASPTSLTISAIPKSAKTVSGAIQAAVNAVTSQLALGVQSTSSGLGNQGPFISETWGNGQGWSMSFRDLLITSSQTIFYTATSSGTPTFSIFVTEYTF